MMCSQLLEGLKCESQIENSGRARSRGHALWFVALQKGRGACWSFGMKLGRIDKLHLLIWAYIKPTQGGQCIVEAHLLLRRATGNSNSYNSPRPGLGRSHHLPPYSIFYVTCSQVPSQAQGGPQFLKQRNCEDLRAFSQLSALKRVEGRVEASEWN